MSEEEQPLKPLQVRTFDSFEEADRADLEESWAKTPEERLAELEYLRSQMYPDGIPPRLQRTITFAER